MMVFSDTCRQFSLNCILSRLNGQLNIPLVRFICDCNESNKAITYINVLNYKLNKVIMACKKDLKIPKGVSETVNRRMVKKKIKDN